MFENEIVSLLVAQDGSAPPVPGEAPAGTPATGTTGTAAPGVPGTNTAAPSSPFGNQFFLIMMLVIVGMLIFSWRGTRRDKKKRESMLGAIKKHDKVQTIGGVIGSVVEVKPDTVVLKVDESSNTRITFSRSAIQQVLTVSPDVAVTKSSAEN